ncbi:hypothetical protein N0V93_008407 [Gnomoniopsis smithogilvyi]|uniref:NAD(P)-binding protein n=1 Tax=Gnomoniopsis smithogilvyi TaxID=1191159 RepID=A0A9W8YPZ9_9PEZI|nr:hypothetical protein N0V93_008407 [Gnomoniopsis smithogilvyi]
MKSSLRSSDTRDKSGIHTATHTMASDKTVGDFSVKGKILLITGGGSGIGLSFARLFHTHGGRVLIGDVKLTSAAEDFIHTTEVDSPGSVIFRTCDVTDWKSLHSLISASVLEFGEAPDVYCPCAGIFEPPWSNFWDDTEDDGYATIKINTEHPIKLTRLAFRALLGAEKKGVVMHVASAAGLIGSWGCALYCASKHAIVGLCKSLGHADGSEGVKVVCICPGIVKTPLWEDREDDRAKDYKYGQEGSPTITPDEVAEAMLRLVEEGKYGGGTVLHKNFSGEKIVFEGGQSLYDVERPKTTLDNERGKKWDVTM